MALEINKITSQIDELSGSVWQRKQQRAEQVGELLNALHVNCTAWERIERCLGFARTLFDGRVYRAAQPIEQQEALNQDYTCGDCPPQATVVAVDGSQILPDRHRPFFYALINVGVFVYHHGRPHAPDCRTQPTLRYPVADLNADDAHLLNAININAERDLAEITQLADALIEQQAATPPVLGLLDQRLFYWPDSRATFHKEIVNGWLEQLGRIQRSGALIAGYVERPGSAAVVNMLRTLTIEHDDFDPQLLLTARRAVTDADLFRTILQPGARSKVFGVVDTSLRNERYFEADQEMCFFYLRPGASLNIARVDLPRWAATQPGMVDKIHALLLDQCNLTGWYPYALMRADELAVVGKQDQDELDMYVQMAMQRRGISADMTGKLLGKEWSRAGKRQHAL